MAKVIAEKAVEPVESSSEKQVEIKHTKVMKNASGNNVTVVDFTEVMSVDDAISQSEAQKASLEASLVDVEAELAEYKAIKDAE